VVRRVDALAPRLAVATLALSRCVRKSHPRAWFSRPRTPGRVVAADLQLLVEPCRDLVFALWCTPELVRIEQTRRRVDANIPPLDRRRESRPIVLAFALCWKQIIVRPRCAANNLRMVPVCSYAAAQRALASPPPIDHRQLVSGENSQ